MTKSILVGFDKTKKTNGEEGDATTLVVAEKTMNQSINILNVFSGEEAEELWNKLIGDKELGVRV